MAITAFSQLPSNAAGYEKSFWQYIEKLKVTDPVAAKGAFQNSVMQAQTNLKQLKKYAPTYDVSKHEAALRPFTEADASASAAKRLAEDRENVESYLTKVAAAPVGYMRDSPLYGAEASLATLKKNSPNFDASAYEKQIADFKAAQGTKSPASDNAGNAGASGGASTGGSTDSELNSKYMSIFLDRGNSLTWRDQSSFSTDEIAAAEKKCVAIRDKFNAFVNSELGQRGKGLAVDPPANPLKRAVEDAGFLQSKVAKLGADYSFNNSQGSAVRDYFQMVQLVDLWTAQAKLFPQSAVVQQAAQSVNALRAETGDLQTWIKKAESKNAAEVSAVRLAPASHRDATLEAEFKSIFQASGWGTDVIKVNLVSTDWQIIRNEATGAILNRRYFARVVEHEEDGKCIVHDYNIQQDYNGGSYGRSHQAFMSDTAYEILCEHVK